MPKLYEYLGIVVFFYSHEHEPIHVHAQYNEQESKAEFFILDGKITEIRISSVKGTPPLKGKQLQDFKDLLSHYSDEIIEKWIDYFVLHKHITTEKITKRLQ